MPEMKADSPFVPIIKARGWSDPGKEGQYIPTVVANLEGRLRSHLPDGRSVSFTELQRSVLEAPGFWEDWEHEDKPRHLIVQGSTSSGKTLVSELAILDTLCHGKKAVVLVPLRAMVRERAEHFRQDMGRCPRAYKVFGSSADYVDNDNHIIEGNYDVAVIVYEKFFAMLSNPDCRVLEDCKLIVVDELSMLSKKDRGPKLEIALEVAMRRSPVTRILCLVTNDCRTDMTAAWLKSATILSTPTRPVGLDEYVMQVDGMYRHRHIEGEVEAVEGRPEPPLPDDEGKLSVPGFNAEERDISRQKRKTLLSILHEIHDKQPEAKILVFVATRKATASIARFLLANAPTLFPKVGISERMSAQLVTFEQDEDRRALENEYLPHGIAYHHAGVSTTLRECVEEEFQEKDSRLRLIIATETLAIGVNMPFDVMIMMDNEVPKSEGRRQPISYQEYRNYIGRAGRLGQTNRCGTSFLIVPDQRTQDLYWYAYRDTTNGAGQEIESALTGVDSLTQAPYILALAVNAERNRAIGKKALGRDEFQQTLTTLHAEGFASKCGSCDFDAETVDAAFEKHWLLEVDRDPFEDVSLVRFSSFAQSVAPFALSFDTLKLIHNYFVRNTVYGLPHDASGTDVENDRFLLELLYHLCRHPEVVQSNMLAVPSNGDIRHKIEVLLPHKIKALEEDGQDLWATDEHPFGSIRELDGRKDYASELSDFNDKPQAGIRALALYWWTKGESVKSIRRLTGLEDLSITNGDLERLASIVSYHLDAIYYALEHVNTVGSDMRRELYWLQVRVKYGMPLSGIPLANKHVHGLDRPRVLRFIHEVEARGETPLDVLFKLDDTDVVRFFTPLQLSLLRKRNLTRRSGDHFETLVKNIRDEGRLTVDQIAYLEHLHHDDSDPRDVEETVSNLIELIDSLSFSNKDVQSFVPRIIPLRDRQVVRLKWDVRTAFIGFDITGDGGEAIDTFRQEKQRDANCVTCFVTSDPDDVDDPICDMAMDDAFFELLIAKAVSFEGNGIRALQAFLFDARGAYDRSDWNHINLKDYFPTIRKENPSFRYLTHLDNGYGALSQAALTRLLDHSDDLADYETVSIADSDYLLAASDNLFTDDTLLVIRLSRDDISRSNAATRLLHGVAQRHYHNCLILLQSDEEARWRDVNARQESLCGEWYTSLCSAPNDVLRAVETSEEAIAAIREMRRRCTNEEYLIGVSFSRFYPERQGGDVAMLRKLVDGLIPEFGRHRILYCEYPESQGLFHDDRAKDRSLAAYRQCSIYLVLDNEYTAQSEACWKEHEVIRDRCGRNEARCFYLAGKVNGGLASEGAYLTPLTIDSQELAQDIRKRLMELGKQQETQ